MRFFGALFLGACYANVAERSEPVLTTLIPEVANPPKETQASVEARLALVAVCPEATANCSVPTGQEAENEELADALDCMLKVDINTIPPGPCHDALKKFLDDHLNPSNRAPQGPASPTVLIMRSQPGPSPLAEILQRMAANSRPMPMPQPMMFPFQDPRFQQSYPQNYPMGPDRRSHGQSHGFPPMFGGRMDDYEMRSQGRSRTRNSRNRDEEDGHWDLVWHSTRDEPKESRFGRGSPRMSSHHMPPPPPRHVSAPSRYSRMSAPSRSMPSSHMSSRMSSQRQVPSSRGSSRMSSSSSSMNPMMMMLLPHLMSQGPSQNPMSGILMATMMKNMASNSYDYDYDYSYDYDYDDEALDDYDYDYDYEDESEPSPLASMIRKMLQQKLASQQATVQMSLDPTMIEPVTIVDSPLEVSSEDPVEIQPSRARSDKESRIEQVSYRSAP